VIVRKSPHPLTAEDLLRPDTPYGDCELWDGTAVVREPSGGGSDFVTARVTFALQLYLRDHALGRGTGSEAGWLVARDPDRLLAADAAFVSFARLPEIPSRGFCPCTPEFVVETRSPSDRWPTLLAKAGVWMGHGACVVWLIDPMSRTVTILRPGADPLTLGPGASADAEPTLPGFRVELASLFEGVPFDRPEDDVTLR
jgi:Uma2 family endonuclease